MMRHVLTENRDFKIITQEHLNEEFNHNLILYKDRNNDPPIWDPILEATSAWFTWKMLCLDNQEKTLLMHLVLEASADIFFKAADIVLGPYNETNYFSLHAALDEDHKDMANILLKDVSKKALVNLLTVQQQGWEMLYQACNRIADISLVSDEPDSISYILQENEKIRAQYRSN